MSELLDEAQAETVVKFGPRKPYLMEICPGAISAIIFGIKNGLKRGVPSPLAKLTTSSRNVFKPPIPDPQITPILLVSSLSKFNPASFTASSVENKAYCTKGSSFRASFLPKKASASKFFTSQANLVLNFSVSKLLIKAAPLTPFINDSQYSGTVLPIGVSAPSPVTTTLLNSI